MLVVPMPPQPSHLHPPSTSSSSPYSPPAPTSPAPSFTPGDSRPKIASRPKLTLQTSSLPRTFGRSTTGLSLSVATSSPTVSNTFKNAYECPASAIPPTTTYGASSPIKPSSQKFSKPASPFPSYNSGPYQLPLGVKSILRNSPLEPSCRRSVSTVHGGGGASSSRRVFFPPKKQVSYRQPLEEEIRTRHYMARHSDLLDEEEPSRPREEKRPQSHEEGSGSSDSDSNSSQDHSDSSSGSDDDHTGARTEPSLTKIERKKRKTLSAERQVRAVALLDGLEDDPYGNSTPQTPRQSRVKRRREWKWTLGSVEARNEAYGLPRTPEEANVTVPEKENTENDHETESVGSSESDWTTTSTSTSNSFPGSSGNTSHTMTTQSDESKINGS